jgi:hypothetical protein
MCSHPQILCHRVLDLDLGIDVYINIVHETWPSTVEITLSSGVKTRNTHSRRSSLASLYVLSRFI